MKQITSIFLFIFVCQWPSMGAVSGPGELYRTHHDQWVAQFDLNGDRWLNAEEREKMRATPKPKGKRFSRGGEKRDKNGVRRDMPQHWVDKYDKDGDGGLSDKEAEKGYWTERSMLFKAYDVDENEKLDPSETGKLAEDIEKGKYQSWDHFVAQTTLKDAEREHGIKGLKLRPRQQRWLDWDQDGDGRASEEEITAIRKAEKE